MRSTVALPPGMRLGVYEVIAQIGTSGMGEEAFLVNVHERTQSAVTVVVNWLGAVQR